MGKGARKRNLKSMKKMSWIYTYGCIKISYRTKHNKQKQILKVYVTEDVRMSPITALTLRS